MSVQLASRGLDFAHVIESVPRGAQIGEIEAFLKCLVDSCERRAGLIRARSGSLRPDHAERKAQLLHPRFLPAGNGKPGLESQLRIARALQGGKDLALDAMEVGLGLGFAGGFSRIDRIVDRGKRAGSVAQLQKSFRHAAELEWPKQPVLLAVGIGDGGLHDRESLRRMALPEADGGTKKRKPILERRQFMLDGMGHRVLDQRLAAAGLRILGIQEEPRDERQRNRDGTCPLPCQRKPVGSRLRRFFRISQAPKNARQLAVRQDKLVNPEDHGRRLRAQPETLHHVHEVTMSRLKFAH